MGTLKEMNKAYKGLKRVNHFLYSIIDSILNLLRSSHFDPN